MILNLFSITSSYIGGIFQTKGLHSFGIMFGLMVVPSQFKFSKPWYVVPRYPNMTGGVR